jgi:hypothetical protein
VEKANWQRENSGKSFKKKIRYKDAIKSAVEDPATVKIQSVALSGHFVFGYA